MPELVSDIEDYKNWQQDIVGDKGCRVEGLKEASVSPIAWLGMTLSRYAKTYWKKMRKTLAAKAA